jgi:hypothetical protein
MTMTRASAFPSPATGCDVSLSDGRYHSFVVRIWSGGNGTFRGQVTHVGTRRSIRFADMQRLIGFMQTHLAAHPEQWLIDELSEEQAPDGGDTDQAHAEERRW